MLSTDAANSILDHYRLPESILTITPLTQGLIHQTYWVKTATQKYILQKIHSVFAEAMHANVHAAQEHLRSKNIPTRETIKTKDGALFVRDHDVTWRLTTFIPGRVFDVVENTEIARGAGGILGTFHKALSDINFSFQPQRVQAVSAETHFERFQEVVAEQHMNDEMQQWRDEIFTLPSLFLPNDLRTTPCQGDTKISNIVFAKETLKPVTMIDLDDVGPASPLVDLGNAMRSWCGKVEDNPQNTFHLGYFAAAYTAYQSTSENLLSREEQELLPRAILCITLTLASRFFRDFFEDTYFAYDSARYTSRKEHNLARTKGQMQLYADILKKEQAIRQIIRET